MRNFPQMLLVSVAFLLVVTKGCQAYWRAARGRGRWLPRPGDVGWGAALVPVTILYLASYGVLVLVDGVGQVSLFGSTTHAVSVLLGMVTVATVLAGALAWPRQSGYLAAIGLSFLGLWVLFEAVAFRPYAYDIEWYRWLRDELDIQELCLLGGACLVGGFVLTRHTIVAGIRARERQLTVRVERLAEIRAEAVDSAAAELRRLERDLHDGAQARLVALGINLRTAEKLIKTSPDDAMTLVAECRDTATLALTELRDLVRGIYPPVLADRGLGDAVKALALDCPVLTLTDIQLTGRPPAPVESAVYFAIAEALSNAAKHAEARAVLIRVAHDGHMLRAEIHDDGVGGADPARGTGLAGMERRLAAFDGILAVSSPMGGPTIVVIEVPCALSSPKTSTS